MAQNRDASDGTGCQQPEGPALCSNNCGFLGCSATMNLCSNCYRELVLKQANHCPPLAPHGEKDKVPDDDSSLLARSDLARSALLASLAAPFSVQEGSTKTFYAVNSSFSEISDADLLSSSSLSLLPSLKEPVVSVPAVTSLNSRSSSHQIGKRHTGNRCLTCGRRVTLLAFKCRCGDIFCVTHRYSDKHNCSFDYKAAGRDAIAKANPVVVAAKVKKI